MTLKQEELQQGEVYIAVYNDQVYPKRYIFRLTDKVNMQSGQYITIEKTGTGKTWTNKINGVGNFSGWVVDYELPTPEDINIWNKHYPNDKIATSESYPIFN